MWTDEYDEDTISEGNVLDILALTLYATKTRWLGFIVSFAEKAIPAKQAGLFLLGHRHYHLWVIELMILGGA